MTKDEIKKEIESLEFKIASLKTQLEAPEFIDLGLPSGTLWADCNEEGNYDFDTAVETFGDNLPKLWQLCELWENCTIKDNVLTGPNGNFIKLPYGDYWSSTAKRSGNAYGLYFDGSAVGVYRSDRSNEFSVRCCTKKL